MGTREAILEVVEYTGLLCHNTAYLRYDVPLETS
jgi:hypothetical protein